MEGGKELVRKRKEYFLNKKNIKNMAMKLLLRYIERSWKFWGSQKAYTLWPLSTLSGEHITIVHALSCLIHYNNITTLKTQKCSILELKDIVKVYVRAIIFFSLKLTFKLLTFKMLKLALNMVIFDTHVLQYILSLSSLISF